MAGAQKGRNRRRRPLLTSPDLARSRQALREQKARDRAAAQQQKEVDACPFQPASHGAAYLEATGRAEPGGLAERNMQWLRERERRLQQERAHREALGAVAGLPPPSACLLGERMQSCDLSGAVRDAALMAPPAPSRAAAASSRRGGRGGLAAGGGGGGGVGGAHKAEEDAATPATARPSVQQAITTKTTVATVAGQAPLLGLPHGVSPSVESPELLPEWAAPHATSVRVTSGCRTARE